jgi:hypothetical protein
MRQYDLLEQLDDMCEEREMITQDIAQLANMLTRNSGIDAVRRLMDKTSELEYYIEETTRLGEEVADDGLLFDELQAVNGLDDIGPGLVG